jgi:membrane protein required for colicin V production
VLLLRIQILKKGNRGKVMNTLDWVLIGIGLLGVLRGVWRGAVSQIFGIAGVLGGFLAAAHYHQTLSIQLSNSFPKLTGTAAISFAVIFLLTWLSVSLLGYLAAKILHRGGLGFLDRLLGAMVGLGKAGIMAVVLLFILTFFMSPQNVFLSQSVLAPHIQAAAQLLVAAAPENLRAVFDRKSKELREYWLEHKGDLAESARKSKKDRKAPNDRQ